MSGDLVMYKSFRKEQQLYFFLHNLAKLFLLTRGASYMCVAPAWRCAPRTRADWCEVCSSSFTVRAAAAVADEMAAKPEHRPNVYIHIKITYFCILLLTASGICGFWICLTRLHALREEFEAKFAKNNAVVEFENFDALSERGRHVGGDDADAVLHEDDLSEETLSRVKRQQQHAFRPANANNREGSGAPEDWVWLTSYSRIPVSLFSTFVELKTIVYMMTKVRHPECVSY